MLWKPLNSVSGISAVVKVVDSHICGRGSIPGNSCSCLIMSLSKGLSLCFMCSDQHAKYRMPYGFPLTSILLDYHVKQYTHTPWSAGNVCCVSSASEGVTWFGAGLACSSPSSLILGEYFKAWTMYTRMLGSWQGSLLVSPAGSGPGQNSFT